MGDTVGTLVPFLVALSFAAGLNVYATTGTLGILGRLGWVALPPGLNVLSSRWVVGASVACFAVEFFADKVPYFDLVWNVLHTFVRIPVAALLAYRASIAMPPEMQWALTAMAAGVATVAHGSKTAARTLVSASPEPLTNAGLSSGEDALAIGLAWLATTHPWVAGIAAAAGVAVAAVCARWVARALRKVWARLTRAGRDLSTVRS
jgi:hypothetical protein